MKRRIFLKNTGLAALAGTAAAGAGLYALQPRRTVLPFAAGSANALLPEQLQQPRQVVVVGGGLAGIAAAYELIKRGFQVTLIERSKQLGGRLTGWTVDVQGESMAMEHGFHGFFNQYYNVRELLGEVDLLKNLKPVTDYPIIFKDKGIESFTYTTTIFPFNLLAVVNQAKSVSLMDFHNPGSQLHELMRYDPVRTFEQLDQIDFKTFCMSINQPMVETIIEPFAHTSFNQFHQYSTAEGIKFFHFFYLGNPDGMGYDQTIDDAMTSVVTPLTQRLMELGCQVMTGIEVERLLETDGRISGLTVKAPGAISGQPPRIAIADVGTQWRPFWGQHGDLYFVKRDHDGQYQALSGRCTHMGCPVGLSSDHDGFACPCHGAHYDNTGVPIAGPTKKPLVSLTVQVIDEQQLQLHQPSQLQETFAADYVVLACDVPGLQEIIAHSTLSNLSLVKSIEHLAVTDPYIVWRIWFDRAIDDLPVPFYTVSGYRYTDSIAIYSQLQPQYQDWAQRHQGCVIELHAYAVEEDNVIPEAEIKQVMRDELNQLIPQLQGASILYDVYTMQENFPRWAPGDYAGRPGIATPVENLFLAGDFVRLEIPANLMEAATMSGRIAANHILVAEGLRENAIPTVDLTGPLVWG
jgi:isorenieratene synthase